jgi:hypothetical protein
MERLRYTAFRQWLSGFERHFVNGTPNRNQRQVIKDMLDLVVSGPEAVKDAAFDVIGPQPPRT